jgi:N-acetylmuramoyl-L-alanine amidase
MILGRVIQVRRSEKKTDEIFLKKRVLSISYYFLMVNLFFNVSNTCFANTMSSSRNINLIVIHATGGPDCNLKLNFKSGSLQGISSYFKKNKRGVSIHYIIGRKGQTIKMEPENRVAYHVRNHNKNSIGIELINNGDGKDHYSAQQITALTELLIKLTRKYELNIDQIKGHDALDNSDIVCKGKHIKRKQDPGKNFPWKLILRKIKKQIEHEKQI